MHLPRVVRLALATSLVATLPWGGPSPTASATPANPDNPRSSRLALSPADNCYAPFDRNRTTAFRFVEAGRYWCAGLTQDHRILESGEFYPRFPTSAYDEFGDFVRISVGNAHGLALDDAGDVAAWGTWQEWVPCDDWACDEPEEAVTVPAEVQDATITQIAAGAYHDLALTDEGEVLTWGPATSEPEFQVPAALDGQRVVRIDAGPNTSAAITAAGRLHVWGDFGDSTLPPRLRDPATRVTAVDVSRSWGLALTDDTLLAFGDRVPALLNVPTAVRRGDVVAFAAGDFIGLAGTANGGLHSWPPNGEDATSAPPRLAGPLIDLSAGYGAATALYRRIVATRYPRIPRNAVVGQRITALRPTWSVTPTKLVLQWTRNGRPIAGARGLTYRVTRADRGYSLGFVAIASAPGYPTTRAQADGRVTVPGG